MTPRSTYILATTSGGINDGPVAIGATDVKEVDINYPFFVWEEKASYGCVGEGTYIAACEDKLQDQRANQRSNCGARQVSRLS